jgi:hypothetical protein
MKFNRVFLEKVNKHLKRVRIKVDPKLASYENFRSIDAYEGYILEENDQFLRIMLIKQGSPIVDVPKEALTEPKLLDHFRYFILDHIQMLENDPVCCNVKEATSFEDMEEVLKMKGLTDAEIVNLYREFIKCHA